MRFGWTVASLLMAATFLGLGIYVPRRFVASEGVAPLICTPWPTAHPIAWPVVDTFPSSFSATAGARWRLKPTLCWAGGA
jgi:hypothetical protein